MGLALAIAELPDAGAPSDTPEGGTDTVPEATGAVIVAAEVAVGLEAKTEESLTATEALDDSAPSAIAATNLPRVNPDTDELVGAAAA